LLFWCVSKKKFFFSGEIVQSFGKLAEMTFARDWSMTADQKIGPSPPIAVPRYSQADIF
jgi:hypothetical protein